MFSFRLALARLLSLLLTSVLILQACDGGGSDKGGSNNPPSSNNPSSSSSSGSTSSSSSSSGVVTAPTLTFVTGDPNNLQVGEVVLLSASGVELREGAIFSGTLRGDPVQLVALANGNLTFVLPNVYPGNARLEVTIAGQKASADVTIGEWTEIADPDTAIDQTLTDIRQQLENLITDEQDTELSAAITAALEQLSDAKEALQQLSAEELQQVAIIISRLQTALVEDDSIIVPQAKPHTKILAAGLPGEWAVYSLSEAEWLNASPLSIDTDVCIDQGIAVLQRTIIRTWKIGALVAIGGYAGALGGLPGILVVGAATGIFLVELDKSIKANNRLLDSCIDPIERSLKETIGISSQSLKANNISALNSSANSFAFEHGIAKYFSITTTYSLPDLLKQEVTSWYSALLNIMDKLPLPERWLTSIEKYLSPIEKEESPTGLQLEIYSDPAEGSLSATENGIRLVFEFKEINDQRFENLSFKLVDPSNDDLSIRVDGTLAYFVDCTKFYSAVLGEWSVTLTTNYGIEPTTYRLMVYEDGTGEYFTGEGDAVIRYRVTWRIYSGRGLNGAGCIFTESGFWHSAFDSNPSSIMDYPLTGFYTEQWFPSRDGGEEEFDRRTYIKK